MPKIRNVSGEARTAPGLGGLVLKGQVVECPVQDVYSYTCQELWEPVDDEAKAAHEQAAAAEREALIEAGVIRPEPEPAFDVSTAKGPELKAYAKEHEIDLAGAKKVEEIRAVIVEALAGPGGDPNDNPDPDQGEPGDDNTPQED